MNRKKSRSELVRLYYDDKLIGGAHVVNYFPWGMRASGAVLIINNTYVNPTAGDCDKRFKWVQTYTWSYDDGKKFFDAKDGTPANHKIDDPETHNGFYYKDQFYLGDGSFQDQPVFGDDLWKQYPTATEGDFRFTLQLVAVSDEVKKWRPSSQAPSLLSITWGFTAFPPSGRNSETLIERLPPNLIPPYRVTP